MIPLSAASRLLIEGPHADVVLSCRVRLARNLAGFPFVNRATNTQRHELLKLAKDVLLSCTFGSDMYWVDLTKAPDRDRLLLVERHLISKPHAEADAPRGVAFSADETLSIMINEEDHLRMQILASGLQLEQAFARINDVDDIIESKLDYAFSRRWGYLCACPTNVGTGIRLSVMMHLPGLKLTNEIERVRRAAKDLHLAVRGYYGEGSDSAGDFYQISNQVTLGRSEQDLMEEFAGQVIPRMIEYEREARRMLAQRRPALLDDRVFRSLALLRSARLLGADEAMKLLSRVRLGVAMGRLPEITSAVVSRLFLQVQPAHLMAQSAATLSPDELREARAALIRQSLS